MDRNSQPQTYLHPSAHGRMNQKTDWGPRAPGQVMFREASWAQGQLQIMVQLIAI